MDGYFERFREREKPEEPKKEESNEKDAGDVQPD